MKISENKINLLTALVAVQSEIQDPIKNATNPHLRNQYADLNAVLDVVRPVFSKHGLSLLLLPTSAASDLGFHVGYIYVIGHAESGEFVTHEFLMPVEKLNAQSVGAVLTYLRRYIYTAIAGVSADKDNDGEQEKPAREKPKPATSPGEAFAALCDGAKRNGWSDGEVKDWIAANGGKMTAGLIPAFREYFSKARGEQG